MKAVPPPDVEKMKAGGVMCGHDYNWEGVKRAVDEAYPVVQGGGDDKNHVWWIAP